jgi:DNA-3-methyladenine glycosylase I
VNKLDKDNVHVKYHDTQYGFPIKTDNELFGRLLLEINQAGLNWTTILNKQRNFKKAYSSFSINKIAAYKAKDINRLLKDEGIIRNKLKVNAAIYNAKAILEIKKEFGTFKKWLDHYHPLNLEQWVKLFKKYFKFTGGEITKEFLMSTGYLKGAHMPSCKVYKEISKLSPPWKQK